MRHSISLLLTLVAFALCPGATLAADVPDLIQTLKSVGNEGAGHSEAVVAVRELSAQDASTALVILPAMKDANALALNWLQGAFESIAQRALANNELDAGALEDFVNDLEQNPRARRLAYEWLVKVDPGAEQRLIPHMLNDPSPELRRDAVAHAIGEAEHASPGESKVELWRSALNGAVDEDQVKLIAGTLKDLGAPVDLIHHFGFLTEWHLIGPFDNRDMQGFDVAYPPEAKVDLSAEYTGMKGPVRWERYQTDSEDGLFNIAKLTEPHKGAIDYAYTEFVSGAEQTVDFRLATKNAWKLWLNGELLFAREEYHRGTRFDQYTVKGHLQPGTNRILLKVCQNEQTQDWAQDWDFRFRVCDFSGRAIHPNEARTSAAR